MLANSSVFPAVSASLFILLSLQAYSAQAEDMLDSILVEDSIDINPNTAEPDNYNRSQATSSDGGDFLKQINGISGSRFGGRGIEPIIRGQSQTRLNILLDGSYVHGGCPNRMDPPASWAALETYESVTILKGVQTLTHGSGGSGGTVLFERDTRSLAEDEGLHGRVSILGSNNQIDHDLMADVVGADENFYVRGIAEIKKSGNYDDGDGDEVRAAFDHKQAGAIIGYMPSDESLLEFSFEQNDFSDALYPGAGMDSPEEKGKMTRLRYLDKPEISSIDEVKVEIYRSDIDHVMDNYSLRVNTGTRMRSPTSSLTTGGRMALQSSVGNSRINYGLDLQTNERDASLDNMDTGIARSVSVLWPDIEIRQTGLFAEATTALDNQQKIKTGLRVDFVDVSFGKANTTSLLMGGRTANQSYQAYYGTTANDKTETNLGALLRYEKKLAGGLSFFSGISQTVRTADATERGINKWVVTTSERWIGNPDIKPEKHRQIDLGLARANTRYSANVTVYFDRVSDYILRDGARGQDGILLSDNADIYRNVDAELYGMEAEARFRLDSGLDISTSLATVRATNTTDNRPLAQTPPVNGKLQLDYKLSGWGLGSRIRFAAKQTRIDVLSKQEVGTTAGYGVLDVYGNTDLNRTISLRFGMDNVFDKTYAEHASRSNLLDNNAVKVNEPGRTAWLKLAAEF